MGLLPWLCGRLAAFPEKLSRSAPEHSLNSKCATAASPGRWLQLGPMRHLIALLTITLSIQCNIKRTQDLLGSWREVYPKYPYATNYDSLVFASPNLLKTYTITNSYVTDSSLATFTLTKDGYLITKWTWGVESASGKSWIVKLTTDSLVIEPGNHSLIRYKRAK